MRKTGKGIVYAKQWREGTQNNDGKVHKTRVRRNPEKGDATCSFHWDSTKFLWSPIHTSWQNALINFIRILYDVQTLARHGALMFVPQVYGIQAGHKSLCPACYRSSTALMRPYRPKQSASICLQLFRLLVCLHTCWALWSVDANVLRGHILSAPTQFQAHTHDFHSSKTSLNHNFSLKTNTTTPGLETQAKHRL